MNKILIEQIINMNCIKYNRMVEIVNEAFRNSDANEVNIYIDLYSILRPLYKASFDIKDYSVVTSSIINICSHYRSFFKNCYKTYANFYLIFSNNCPMINKQFYYGYNSNNEKMIESNKLITDMIEYNIKLLELLCPYLPNIHFIKGTFETGTIMYDMICRNSCKSNNPHIILTKDLYNYQIIPTMNNVIILRPKKNKGEDESYYISNINVIERYIKDREKSMNSEKFSRLMPGMLSMLMTLSSVKNRNIKSLLNISKANMILNTAIENNQIQNGYNSTTSFIWDLFQNDFNISKDGLESRFKAIDIVTQQRIYMNTPESKNIKILNLYDPKTIKIINNQYFITNPLDLERL